MPKPDLRQPLILPPWPWPCLTPTYFTESRTRFIVRKNPRTILSTASTKRLVQRHQATSRSKGFAEDFKCAS